MNSISKRIGDYLSLVKFSHTVFALPFAIIGFSLASTSDDNLFSIRILILILLNPMAGRP